MEAKSIAAPRQDRKTTATEASKRPGNPANTAPCTVTEYPTGAVTQREEQSPTSIAVCDYDPKQRPERLETFDPLTELYSRQAILGKLCELVNLANRYKEDFSLTMLDIDHFKKLNDHYGHLTGDKVLKQVATLVRGNIRNTDIAGRYGGDEFVIVLPRTNLSSSWVVAERLRSMVEKTGHKDPAGNVFAVTVSQGLVGWEQNDDVSSLISRADEALHKAKEKGRNRTQILLGPSLRDKI
jgi:diguanylate cyclase (GGDEF)-like protein